MKNLTSIAIAIGFVLILASCQKEEKIVHEELIVQGNQAPDYNGISSVLIKNYVNKVYIDLLGIEAAASEADSLVAFLKENSLSAEARKEVIGALTKYQEYHDRLFQISTDLFLNGMSMDEIDKVHTEYAAVRDLFYQQGDTFSAQFIGFEVKKLEAVLNAPQEYQKGDIDLNEYYRRLSYNLIYDEINMGSDNFVISCFENLFKRKPTESEKETGVNMVDGISTQVLRKEGRTKADFLDIVTQDIEFYQGRVLDAFRTYLQRDPSSSEMGEATASYVETNDYSELQISILITDEYAGFK